MEPRFERNVAEPELTSPELKPLGEERTTSRPRRSRNCVRHGSQKATVVRELGAGRRREAGRSRHAPSIVGRRRPREATPRWRRSRRARNTPRSGTDALRSARGERDRPSSSPGRLEHGRGWALRYAERTVFARAVHGASDPSSPDGGPDVHDILASDESDGKMAIRPRFQGLHASSRPGGAAATTSIVGMFPDFAWGTAG